jgi:bile acid:Na+ symporter, BASS family
VDVLAVVLQASVVLFMVLSLASAGLEVATRDVFAPLKHGRFVMLTVVVGWLVGPVIAYLLLQVIPLQRSYATGLLLLAMAPCAPFAPAMMRAARADPAYVAAFMMLSAVVTAVAMPVGVPLLIDGLSASPWAIARPMVFLILAPLLLGSALRDLRPHLADLVAPVIAVVMRVATIGMLVLVVVVHGRGVLDAVGSHAILAQVVFIGAVTLAGFVFGAALAESQRSVLTIGVCTRNMGAALAPLAAIDTDPRAIVMITIAIPVTLGLSMMTASALSRRARQLRA